MQPNVSSRDLFVRAKIEHFEDLADECRLAGRFHAALRHIQSILALDPEYRPAMQLQNSLMASLARLSGEPPAAGQGNQNGTQGPWRSQVILVIDQDVRVLMNLVDTFQRAGFPVAGAGSYDEAIEFLTSCTPDIVISEVNFESGSRGYDLFEMVRSNTNKNAFFFLLTTRHDRDAELVGRRLGVDNFFVKPIEAELVAAEVMQYVSRKRA